MQLHRLDATFGALERRTLTFSPGLNIIEAPNESGKSTLAAFVRVMLYGLPTRDRGALADKNRYLPWSGSPMQGTLELASEEFGEITLRRDTARANSPMGRFSATYAGTGNEVAGLSAAECGETLLGVPREGYERSAFIRQSGLAVEPDAELERRIAALCRKEAVRLAEGQTEKLTVTPKNLEELLGPRKYRPDEQKHTDEVGLVNGLAWTAVGGEILYIETLLTKGSGKITVTGQLGDVMKESAQIAVSLVKSLFPEKVNLFAENDLHIHVPDGATPKDGPSAGITIATSIASAITGRKVRKQIAMTGEITLRGKVLPIGGVKEKILAAKRAGITDIICCNENRRNVEDVPSVYVKGLKFHYVETVKDVLDFALL